MKKTATLEACCTPLLAAPLPEVEAEELATAFKALADPIRRVLMDALFERDGRTLGELETVVNERTEFVLTARDVIHSFWVPQFHQKMDMIPGRVNRFQVVPTQTGTFQGKCAELCGAYHSYMLFNVKVVERDEYDAYIKSLADKGQTGLMPNSLNMEEVMPIDKDLLPEGS